MQNKCCGQHSIQHDTQYSALSSSQNATVQCDLPFTESFCSMLCTAIHTAFFICLNKNLKKRLGLWLLPHFLSLQARLGKSAMASTSAAQYVSVKPSRWLIHQHSGHSKTSDGFTLDNTQQQHIHVTSITIRNDHV